MPPENPLHKQKNKTSTLTTFLVYFQIKSTSREQEIDENTSWSRASAVTLGRNVAPFKTNPISVHL